MRSPVHGVNVVRERQHGLHEAVVVLERDLNARPVHHPLDVDGHLVERLAVAVQVADERRDPTLEHEVLLAVRALVHESDPESLVEVRGLAQAGGDRFPVEIDLVEDLRVGNEARPGAVLARPIEAAVGFRFATVLLDGLERRAALELLDIALAVAQDLDPHLGRKRVHHAHAHAVQATGDLVPAPAELPARVEHGHDHFEGALAGGVLVDRNSPPVVNDLEMAVLADGHVDPGGLVGHGLVDAVVHDLPHQLVQAARIGGTDVHARPFANGLEAFQDLDVGSGVGRGRAACGSGLAARSFAQLPDTDGHRLGVALLRSRCMAHDPGQEAAELLVRAEIDADSPAATGAGDGDPGGQDLAQALLDLLEIVAIRGRACRAPGVDAAGRAPRSGAPRGAVRARARARRPGARSR